MRIKSFCFCFLVTQLCLTLCDPMDCSTPGFPVLPYLLEFSQTHVHWVSGAYPTISSSVTLSSSCPQSFPASGSFPIIWPLASGGQSIRVSASAPVYLFPKSPRRQNPSPKTPSHWESLLCDYMVCMRTLKAILPNKYIQGHIIPQARSASSASLIYNVANPQMTYYLDSL